MLTAVQACLHAHITPSQPDVYTAYSLTFSVLCAFCLQLTRYVLLYRYVHIGESHRGYLGTGSVDFAAFFRALAKYDYKEAITFESFSSAVVSGSLSNTLCVWRNL